MVGLVTKRYFDERLAGTGITFTFDEKNQKVTYRCEKGHEKTASGAGMARKVQKFIKHSEPICADCKLDSTRRSKLEEAKKIFEREGCILLEEEYLDNHKLMKYQCSCGNISQMSVNTFKAGHRCMNCASKRRKVTNKRVYGVEHTMQLKEIQEKVKATWSRKYGVINPMFLDSVKEKVRLTNQLKYGVDHAMQSEEVKQKAQTTCVKNYGVRYPLQCREIMKRAKATCYKNHGVEHSLQSAEVREKGKITTRKKYGCDYSMQSIEVREKGKITSRKKYGVDNPMQNKEIFHRQQASAYRLKSYTCPQGTVLTYQGYENTCLDILLGVISDPLHALPPFDESLLSTSVDPIPYIDPSGEQKYYHPDILVLGHLVIEVKSFYTFNKELEKNLCKFRAAAQECTETNFQVWIIDKKQISTILSFREGRIYFSCGTEYLGGTLPQVVFLD